MQSGTVVAISAYIKIKPVTSQINNLIMHVKLEKQKQNKPKTNRQK
jgi:hypothetical protein